MNARLHDACVDPVLPSSDLRPLLAQVAQRDRTAFRSLYEQTSARLLGIVMRFCGSRALAEEVLQDVYLRVWEKASSYDALSGAPMAWLIAIARHRAIDAVRQRGERMARLAHDSGLDLLAELEAPSEGLDLADRDELKRCLAELGEEQRACIILAYCQGYSREELAMRFDRPVNTVKTWLHRGLATLKACVEAA